MRIVSIVSDRKKVTSGPSIDETERLKVHGTIIECRTKEILELGGRHALVRTLRIPVLEADALDSLRLLDRIEPLWILESR